MVKIDLSGATINLVDPENLAGTSGFTFITCDGGSIVGKPAVVEGCLPTGWQVMASGTKARIGRSGMAVILR